ncbi:hypothetical protein M9H77_20052 [Catharanthus roseus]|uniref:Uncharacterized protein n=1 Tax=Catharanthus roseus TaxID=4058 RepID=A0ACC0AIT8_CATRO|nr:hypothetical protein M9H77_20052 [Catharanthus roseus]
MQTRSSSKRKKNLNPVTINYDDDENIPSLLGGIDRISDLPDPIIHHILLYLPIKSIAQTIVLSKRWKQIWHSFPDLDFTTITTLINSSHNNNTFGKGYYSNFSLINRGANSINQVLSHRDKHSDIRVLRFKACLSFSCLNGLIRRAIKHNVQELDIEVSTDDYFNFPRIVIISESLRVFRLKSRYPGFRLPPPVILKGGFRSLISLSLSRVILYDQPSLINLFDDSSFPMLKSLSLETCSGLKHLNVCCKGIQDLALGNCFNLENLEISCPKIERLRVLSCFDAYSTSSFVKIDAPKLEMIFWSNNSLTENTILENLSSLHEAFVGFFLLHDDLSASKLRSISRFLSGVSHCQCLTLETQCIEILSKNYHLGGLRQPFSRVESLELHTGFNKHNLPGLAHLFRNSPQTQTLVLKIVNDQTAERRKWNRDLWEMSSTGEERYWESQSEGMNSFLHHLKVVKIQGFSECENEISLIKFLLKHGKVLQEMFLICSREIISSKSSKDSLQRQKIKSQIMGFSRASSNAKILFH